MTLQEELRDQQWKAERKATERKQERETEARMEKRFFAELKLKELTKSK